MEQKIVRGRVCWNCVHGHFPKRRGSLLGRGRGRCTLPAGTPPFPRGWMEKPQFWKELEAGAFPDTYESFRDGHAIRYFGHKASLARLSHSNLFDDHDLRREYTYLRWLAEHAETMPEVSWQDVCGYHGFVGEDHGTHRSG